MKFNNTIVPFAIYKRLAICFLWILSPFSAIWSLFKSHELKSKARSMLYLICGLIVWQVGEFYAWLEKAPSHVNYVAIFAVVWTILLAIYVVGIWCVRMRAVERAQNLDDEDTELGSDQIEKAQRLQKVSDEIGLFLSSLFAFAFYEALFVMAKSFVNV